MGLSLSKELLEASRLGHLERVRELATQGRVELDTREVNTGWTPLHWASFRGHFFIVQELASRGADLNAIDEHGMTPIHWATLYARNVVIKKLVEHGSDVNIKDKNGRVPLLIGVTWCSYEVINILVEKTIDLSASDRLGKSALHIASQKGNLRVVKLLLENGANMYARDTSSDSPVDVASTDDVKEFFKEWHDRHVTDRSSESSPPSSGEFRINYSLENRDVAPRGTQPPVGRWEDTTPKEPGGQRAFEESNPLVVSHHRNPPLDPFTGFDPTSQGPDDYVVCSTDAEIGVEVHEEVFTNSAEESARQRENKPPVFERLKSLVKDMVHRKPKTSVSDCPASLDALENENEPPVPQPFPASENTPGMVSSPEGPIPQLDLLLNENEPKEEEEATSASSEQPGPVIDTVDPLFFKRHLIDTLSDPQNLAEISRSVGSKEALNQFLEKMVQGFPTEETSPEHRSQCSTEMYRREGRQSPPHGFCAGCAGPLPGPSEEPRTEASATGSSAPHDTMTVVSKPSERGPLDHLSTSLLQIFTLEEGVRNEQGQNLGAVLSQFNNDFSVCLQRMDQIAREMQKFRTIRNNLQDFQRLLQEQSFTPQGIIPKPKLERGWRQRLADDECYHSDFNVEVEQCHDVEYYKQLMSDNRVYRMTKQERGLGVIINVNTITPYGKNERKGSAIDVHLMKQVFRQLHFKTEIFMDLQSDEILTVLKDVAEDDILKEYECFALCIMSHGHHDAIFGSDGRAVRITDIINCFTNHACANMRGKPKFILVQSCRGGQLDPGCTYQADGPPDEPRKLPDRTDMCVMHSTTEGYKSFRNTETGSYFIQAVADIFKRHAKEDHLLELATSVVDRMSREERGGRMYDEPVFKQAPELNPVSLRKKLYFCPGMVME